MLSFNFQRPRLPSHYYIIFEPPDGRGDEVLHFVSERRRVTLKGHHFREFQQYVLPLLDGSHTVKEIEGELSDLFKSEDLEECLELLAGQNLIEDARDAPVSGEMAASIEPQLNYLHEVSSNPHEAQRKLVNSTVTVFGLGGAGALTALSLAAAQVGTLRCIDDLPVGPADPYLSHAFSSADVGNPRTEAFERRMKVVAPETRISIYDGALASDDQIAEAIRHSDFVVCCADPGQSSLIYKLNRACLQERIRWTSCSASGMEVIVGPTVYPFETACYLCYKMRAVACAENPEDAFAFERFLDRRKRDDSGRRENLVFATGIAANLLGLEVLKQLCGAMPSSTAGRIVTVDLVDLSMKKHLVLRKPWCPACFAQQKPSNDAD
jgi:bacteriocin biosynthesis cyclodehydratase domain-containing protein